MFEHETMVRSRGFMNDSGVRNASTRAALQNVTEDAELLGEELMLRDSLYIVIPLTILYSVILVAGVVGNLINCWVITKIRRMHTSTNFYLFSLSVSDLLLLISGLPQEIYYIWYRYPYIFGETFCIMRGLMAETSANATVLTITAFSVERYVAICYPFLARAVSDSSRTIKVILTIWLLALLFAIPQALQFGLVPIRGPGTVQCTLKRTIVPYSFELSTIFFFVVPMIVITILHTMMSIKLKKRAKTKRSLVRKSLYAFSATSANTSRTSMFNQQRPSRRVYKKLVAIVVTFFICWAPFHAQRLVAIYIMSSLDDSPESDVLFNLYDYVTYISAILYYTSSMMNPVLYQISSYGFRQAFKEAVGGLYSRTSDQEISG